MTSSPDTGSRAAGAAGTTRVTGLFVHPVKSMAGRTLERADVLARGLVDDRSWMVTDLDGDMVTARTLHRLLGVEADTRVTDPTVGEGLRLRAAGLEERHVVVPDGEARPVTLFGNDLSGVPADADTQAWLRRALARDDVQLVWCAHPEQRRLNPKYAAEGDHTAYADGYPVTVVSEESLAQLNDWMVADALERGEEPPAPLEMARFRPNVVVRGTEPFAEDGWRRIRVGEVVLRLVKPSPRCVLTTLDPVTLAKGREPIRTLARHRRVDGKVLFAMNAVPETTGQVRVGDPVEVLETA